MSCEHVQERLLELPVEAFHEFDEHLRSCPACSAMADEIRAGEAAIGRYLDDFSVSGDLDAAWGVAQLESAQPEEPPWVRLPTWSLHGAVAALAAAAVLAVTVWPQGREVLQDRANEVARAVWPGDAAPDTDLPDVAPTVEVAPEPESAVVAPQAVQLPPVPQARQLPFEPPELRDTGTPVVEPKEVVVVPAPSLECNDLLAFEPSALKGELAHEEIACLQTRLAFSERMTEKDHISRILMKNAWSKGDRRGWSRMARYHLDEIDRSDPDLAYKYALHLGRKGPTRAWAAIHYAEVAHENRAMWSGDTHVKRVYGIYKLRALSAQLLWNAAEDRHEIEQTEGSRMHRDDMRTMTKVYALEWLEYADAAGKDITLAHQLCVAAAEGEAYCRVDRRR